MFGDNALELIRELNRHPDSLPAFNIDKIRLVLEEMQSLFEENQIDVAASVNGETGRFPSVQLRHAALERNKRCLLAYLYNRAQKIQQMRWEFGSILPTDIRSNFGEPETLWFAQYNKMLANYMSSIGEGSRVDLTKHTNPPKSLYIKVRCVADDGDLETEDGTIVVLKKDTQHFLRSSQCEHLIRQGILEHVL